jgi:hypothetical protein
MLLSDAQRMAALSVAVRPKSGQRRPDTDGGLIAVACQAAVDNGPVPYQVFFSTLMACWEARQARFAWPASGRR